MWNFVQVTYSRPKCGLFGLLSTVIVGRSLKIDVSGPPRLGLKLVAAIAAWRPGVHVCPLSRETKICTSDCGRPRKKHSWLAKNTWSRALYATDGSPPWHVFPEIGSPAWLYTGTTRVVCQLWPPSLVRMTVMPPST